MLRILHSLYHNIKSLLNPLIYQANELPAWSDQKTIPPLPNPCPPFSIYGWNGLIGELGSLEWQAGNVYMTIATSLGFANHVLVQPISSWTGTHNLICLTRSNRSCYDRYSIHLAENHQDGKVSYDCESANMVSKQLWHGILDALRPDLWSVCSAEVCAFHHSFAEIGAMLISEESRVEINEEKDPQSHIFTAAFSEMIGLMHEKYGSTKEAFVRSKDICGRLLLNAVRQAPTTPRFFNSVVHAMLTIDHAYDNECKEVILYAFGKIYQEMPTKKVKITRDKTYHRFTNSAGTAVRICGNNLLRLHDQITGENPLYKSLAEAPNDLYQEFDTKGELQLQAGYSDQEIIESVKYYLDYLMEKDKIGDDKEFVIRNNRIVRNYI